MRTIDALYSQSLRDITFMKEQLQILTAISGNKLDLPDIDETLRELHERTCNIEEVLKDVDQHRLMKAVQ